MKVPDLDRIVVLLERLRSACSRSAGDGDVRARLVETANLVEVYARAVGELRTVALEARGRIELAEAVLDEAREFVRRRRRRVSKAAKHRSDRPARSDA